MPAHGYHLNRDSEFFCLLNLGFGVNGSVVSVQEGQQQFLWTNLHLVQSFLSEWVKASGVRDAQLLKERIKEINIPLILKNHAGEIVFDSSLKTSSDRAYFESVPSSLFLPDSKLSPLGVPDAVKIKLSKNLSHQLVMGQEALPGTPVFLIGFPKPTDNRFTDFQAPDSNGIDQYLTFGEVLQAESLIEQFELSPLTLKFALEEDYKYTLNTDCEQGMSGGALVNQAGEFIGLTQGIFSPSDHGPIACIALKPRSLSFLEAISE